MTKKKKIIGGVCILLAASVVGGTMFFGKKKPVGVPVITTTLESMTLKNTASLTGVVETEEGRKVYSTLNYPVESVKVELGDIVQEGQLLCQLENDSLIYDIQQQKVTMEVSQKQYEHQLSISEKAYENAKKNYENDLNANVLQAEKSVEDADAAVKNARAAVTDARENFRIARSQAEGNVDDAREALRKAESALSSAQSNYNSAVGNLPNSVTGIEANFAEVEANFQEASRIQKDELGYIDAEIRTLRGEFDAHKEKDPKCNHEDLTVCPDNRVLREKEHEKKLMIEHFSQTEENYVSAKAAKDESIAAIQSQANSAMSGVSSAQSGVASANSAYDAAWDGAHSAGIAQTEQAIDSAQRSEENARRAIEAAEKQREATLNAVEEQIDSAKDAIISSQLQAEATRAQEVGLQKLQSTLNDTQIKAPVSGMITAVYAKVGQPGNGLMFVIEDTAALKVSTKIKEYDVASIKEGMPVVIKSDGTGEAEIPGTISKIAPVAIKSSSGDTKGETSVEFETEVLVAAENTGLRIGMNARLSVLLQEKENVFGVSYESVGTRADGTSMVQTVEKNAEGNYVIKEIPITTAMESDFYIEILGDGLKEGMKLISDPILPEGTIVIPDFAATETIGDSGATIGSSGTAKSDTAPQEAEGVAASVAMG